MKKKILASVLSATLIASAFSPLAASAISRTYYSYNNSYSGSTKYNIVYHNTSYGSTTRSYGYNSPEKTTFKFGNSNTYTTNWNKTSVNLYDYFNNKTTTPSQEDTNNYPANNTETTKESIEQNSPQSSYNDTVNNDVADTNPTVETKPSNGVSDSIRQFETEVVRLVNIERQKAGLSPLKENTELSRVARIKSQDMRDKGYFSHTSPTYGSPFDMMKEFGINYMAAGENIAKGQRSPESVVNAWMNSDGHRRNILSSNYTEIGVGYAVDSNGTTYWTQMFIKPRS